MYIYFCQSMRSIYLDRLSSFVTTDNYQNVLIEFLARYEGWLNSIKLYLRVVIFSAFFS